MSADLQLDESSSIPHVHLNGSQQATQPGEEVAVRFECRA